MLRITRRNRTAAHSAEETAPVQPAAHGRVYQNCSELPMPVFVRCSVHHDYTTLLIEGTLPQGDLQHAWMLLFSEFCTISGDERVAVLHDKALRIRLLASRIERVKRTVAQLGEGYPAPSLLESLNADGFPTTLDPSDPDAYNAALDAVLSRLKRDELKLNNLLAEIDTESKKNSKGEEITEAHYEEQAMEISKFEGYPIAIENLYARPYALHLKRLRTHIRHLAAQAAKQPKHGSTRAHQ
jgi:hypothetical protein